MNLISEIDIYINSATHLTAQLSPNGIIQTVAAVLRLSNIKMRKCKHNM
jgi:hypothetical protein